MRDLTTYGVFIFLIKPITAINTNYISINIAKTLKMSQVQK